MEEECGFPLQHPSTSCPIFQFLSFLRECETTQDSSSTSSPSPSAFSLIVLCYKESVKWGVYLSSSLWIALSFVFLFFRNWNSPASFYLYFQVPVCSFTMFCLNHTFICFSFPLNVLTLLWYSAQTPLPLDLNFSSHFLKAYANALFMPSLLLLLSVSSSTEVIKDQSFGLPIDCPLTCGVLAPQSRMEKEEDAVVTC